jgi:hypothetical protein
VHQLNGARWVPTVAVIGGKGDLAAPHVGAGAGCELRRHLEAAGLNAAAATKRR